MVQGEIKWAICEMESFFDKEQDQSMQRVTKVLQVFNTEKEADDAIDIFNPMRFGDYETILRVVSSDYLTDEMR